MRPFFSYQISLPQTIKDQVAVVTPHVMSPPITIRTSCGTTGVYGGKRRAKNRYAPPFGMPHLRYSYGMRHIIHI